MPPTGDVPALALLPMKQKTSTHDVFLEFNGWTIVSAWRDHGISCQNDRFLRPPIAKLPALQQ
jgi:hypothetical protein